MSRLARRRAVESGSAVRFLDLKPHVDDFRAAVVQGLSARPKSLPPKFFYDNRGSELFKLICDTPEYYVTRTELAMLDTLGPELAALAGPDASVIEFGCGSAAKVKKLLAALDEPADYVAIDISRDHLLHSVDEIAGDFPGLNVSAACADFLRPFSLPGAFCAGRGRRLAFFPGSTIGNQTPEEALEFLAHVRGVVAQDGAQPRGALLIGVDLKKDVDVLNAAYNDVAGVTAEFNLNVLNRMQSELGLDVEPAQFAHRAFYNAELGRIEMHLVSRRARQIVCDGRTFTFAAGETIHTESSYKYEVAEFAALCRRAGFEVAKSWTDPAQLFSIHFLEA